MKPQLYNFVSADNKTTNLEDTNSIDENGLPILRIKVWLPDEGRAVWYTCFAEEVSE